MASEKPSIAIVGAGSVGSALGLLLGRAGYPIESVASRSEASARKAIEFIGQGRLAPLDEVARGADVVLITTPDGAIGPVCERIAASGALARGAAALHFSGAMGSDVLDAARRAGAYAAALHPLQSFPSAEQGAIRMAGTVFTLEGDAEVEPLARGLVADLGGELIRIEAGAKPLYHAACCVVSNYMVAVVDLALELYERAGVPRREALRACLPLLKGTVANLEALGAPDALTGPIARGDVATVERHLEAMRPLPGPVRDLYRQLGLRALDAARRKQSVGPDAEARLRALLGGSPEE